MDTKKYKREDGFGIGYYDGREIDKYIRCCVCGKGIYGGDDFYDFFGDTVCDECEFDYVYDNFHKYS